MSALGVPAVGAVDELERGERPADASFACPLAIPDPAPPARVAVLLAAVALVVLGVCVGRAIGFVLLI